MRRWNEDPFTRKAQRENYEARSVYKLKEINEREKIFNGVRTVLDLGAAPGSWTQFCLERAPNAKIIAIDITPLNVKHDRLTFIQKPVEEIDFSSVFCDEKVDLFLSDMAPKTSGIHDADVARSFDLACLALETAKKHLRQKGTLVVKLFMGESFKEFEELLKKYFSVVRMLRPESTRKRSREIYFIAKEFKGVPENAGESAAKSSPSLPK